VIELWQRALESLRQGQAAVLVTVVDAQGPVPGRPGAKMAVTAQGSVGTIGGGVAERQLAERARTLAGGPTLESFEHAGSAEGSFCAGTQVFALLPLGLPQAATLQSIVETLTGAGHGVLRLGSAGLSFTSGQKAPTSFARRGDSWTFAETLGRLEVLTIIGGGHVSLALSRVMATLPFRIVVLDDRAELPTMIGNPFAHETRVIDFERVAEHVPDGDLSYAVIMTYAHLDDQDVLERLVGRDYRYLGMMGSAPKVRQIFANLEAKGVRRERLARVRAPIGLAIGSHTPEEIAISVAAEIVKVRNSSSAG